MSDNVYRGNVFLFIRKNKIGSGGNGGVYDVEIINKEISYPVVAKFFEYKGKDELIKKRFHRFTKEINTVKTIQNSIEGIVRILDSYCSDENESSEYIGWYLMKKGKSFSVCFDCELLFKIDEMLFLAYTLKELHQINKAHRDIKPENLIIFNKKVYLADFGLVWEENTNRITEFNERLGTIKILPPELEHCDLNASIDYTKSDVYLFAKVLWMYIKANNDGFKGPYNRKDMQIALCKNDYGVVTLQPIHKLLKKATCDEIENRISIDKCIEYLEIQKDIILNHLSVNEIRKYQYEEEIEELIQKTNPDVLIYEKSNDIFSWIEKIYPCSKIYIQQVNDSTHKRKMINVSKYIQKSEGIGMFVYYNQGIKVTELIFKVNKLVCMQSSNNEIKVIELFVENFDFLKSEYAEYKMNDYFLDGNYVINNKHKIIFEC